MVGDIGNAEKCSALNLHDTRVPEWLLSDEDLRRADTNRTMARPDLMLINITTQEAQRLHKRKKRDRNGYRTNMLSSRPDVQAIKVLIIEVGYASELRYEHKIRDKLAQHQKLSSAMTQAGYQCEILPIVLRTTCGVFHSNLDSMGQAGISYERSITTLRQLSKHSRDYMQTIIDRRLEKLNPP